jgi:uncharacterized protein (TIGR02466 family)
VVTSPIALTPTFAVPFGETRIEDPASLNDELEALFLARENDEHRNPTPSHIAQNELYESRFNLFRWPDPCVQRLRNAMLDAVARTVLAATDLRPEELARFSFQNHTWFHITRYAGSFISHNHPIASWSAVYCVRAGEPVSEQPDSGMLRFFDPRQGAAAYSDPANGRLRAPFTLAAIERRLVEGQIVVFPSYLFHEVTPFYGRDLRITVATNCWFA